MVFTGYRWRQLFTAGLGTNGAIAESVRLQLGAVIMAVVGLA